MSRRLKKSLGQHFLRDKSVIKRIVDAAGDIKGREIVEIGAGGGALTKEIVKREPRKLFIVEIDREWVAYLREKFSDKAEVLEGDATKFDFSALGKDLIYFGNLPYNVSTAILRNILSHRKTVKFGIFMVQKEVAERLSSKRGKNYGYFPALFSLFFKVEKLFDVPPAAFFPPPKVYSTVIKITPSGFDMKDSKLLKFENFLKTAFSHRRKKLKSNLRIKNTSSEIGKLLEKRAEQLSPFELLELFERLSVFERL